MRNDFKTKPLTSAAFSPFGDVIAVDANAAGMEINDGHTVRYHDLANIDVAAEGGRALMSVFRSTPLELPIKIEKMERHPLSSQAFVPLSGRPYLVVVAPAGEFDESGIKAFLAKPDQGVNFHKGTWHHFSLALEAVSDFLVIDRGGDGDNCDEVQLKKPLSLNP
jgi:ureidoglycolate lyase